MEQVNPSLKKIIESKKEHRLKLAALPFEEKLRLLREMQKRREELLKSTRK